MGGGWCSSAAALPSVGFGALTLGRCRGCASAGRVRSFRREFCCWGVVPVSAVVFVSAVAVVLLLAAVSLLPPSRGSGSSRVVRVGSCSVPRCVVPLWSRPWCRVLLWVVGRLPCRLSSAALGVLAPWLVASAVRWAWWGVAGCAVVGSPPWLAARAVLPAGGFFAPLRAWRGVPAPSAERG